MLAPSHSVTPANYTILPTADVVYAPLVASTATLPPTAVLVLLLLLFQLLVLQPTTHQLPTEVVLNAVLRITTATAVHV